ncbi:MAG: class I SAM-dependent methyltransferase [Chloroflexi bacterium]|nr:class I SAM-dependent methyltransferase [Chloroflexota bacterium]
MEFEKTFEYLKRIATSVGEREGWDFSRMRDAREPVPWNYMCVVPDYLKQSDCVLDMGTGGGEKLLSLAPQVDSAVGVDCSAKMVETALKNKAASQVKNVSFEVMRAKALRFPDGEFDVVLNRHCTVNVCETFRVLRPGGYFITQQVGLRNTQNICALFGCGPGGAYEPELFQEASVLAGAFEQLGCRVVCTAEYDVRYWFLDVESLLFWHQAISIPEDFDIEKHWQQIDQIIAEYRTPDGIETNEHRELLIVQKLA